MPSSIITISRQYGSGGRVIGAALSERLGIPFYERALFEEAAKRSGLHPEFLEHSEQANGRRLAHMFQFGGNSFGKSLDEMAFMSIESTILDIADHGPCVIMGCGANKILSGRSDVLSVYIYADKSTRLRRIIESYGVPADKAESALADMDKHRSSYIKTYTDQTVGIAANYHMCLDSGKLGIESTIRMIRSAYMSM